jgi:PIN domain nuclease of toxin-antitoxin system
LAEPQIFVVDTHALIWYLQESRRLGKSAEAILSDPESTLVVPTIVLAEARYLIAKKHLAVEWSAVVDFIRSDYRVSLYDIDEDIVSLMPLDLEMHDAIICAMAIYWHDVLREEAAVLTRDREIVESGLVRTIW